MTWFSARPVLPARQVTDVLSALVDVIGRAKSANRGPHDLWSRAGEVANDVRARAANVAQLVPYGRASSDFVRRHGLTIGAVGGAVAVGVIAYYFLRAANRAPRRKHHNPSLARHFPSH